MVVPGGEIQLGRGNGYPPFTFGSYIKKASDNET